MSIPSRQILPVSPELLAALDLPPELSPWLGAVLHAIQAAGGQDYCIPAGTDMVKPALADLIPCTADEIDAAIAAL